MAINVTGLFSSLEHKMFEIPISAMKPIIEYMRDHPMELTYPNLTELIPLTTYLPSDTRFNDFVNHVNFLTANIDVIVRGAENLAPMAAQYWSDDNNQYSDYDALEMMVGTMLPEFKLVLKGWYDTAVEIHEQALEDNVDPDYSPILDAMASKVVSENNYYEDANTISQKRAEAMRHIRSMENNSVTGNVMQSAMGSGMQNALKTAQQAISALKQIAEFGSAMEAPGQEFGAYLKGIKDQLQKIVEGGAGAASLVNGVLKIASDGLNQSIPAGIVNNLKTSFPEVQKSLDQISNTVKQVDQSISQAQRAINSIRDNRG